MHYEKYFIITLLSLKKAIAKNKILFPEIYLVY